MRVGKILKSVERFVVHRILHIDDTPHRLALGLALGIFVAWTPTIGVQMVLVVLLATAFKANTRVGIPLVWISNPLTLALIYYPNYLLGRWLLGFFNIGSEADYDYGQLKARLIELLGDGSFLRHFFEAGFWHNLGQLLLSIGLDLWVGSVIIGLFLGIICYMGSYRFVLWYRTHTPQGRLHVLRMLKRRKRRKVDSR